MESIITSLKKNQIYHAVKNMGMLFQGSALFDSMNIEENTAFYLKQHGDPETGKPFPPAEIEQKVKEALPWSGSKEPKKKCPPIFPAG